MSDRRSVAWFSCGDASAVSTRLIIAQQPDDLVIVREVIESEHPDNNRFAADCARWFGREIVEIRSEKYSSHWDVIEQRRYISGRKGALCTTELKKLPRFAFQRVDDIHVFGFTVEETGRISRLREQNPELTCVFPLIDAGLTKADCHAIVERAGIELPMMYRLGFRNNNCIGCSKAEGAGYWNRIRHHFPDAFDRMAKAQRELNYTQVRINRKPVFLDELPLDAGRHDEPEISCSILCEIAESEIEGPPR